ncbi:TIGR02285 family protein [Roseateles sp.]|jgi:uncharacterized protein (TIGR02285 family)|uniref:TIGR02285 family protein n=1 Tax=Roseateles sp. TaxID=1971397 RepID=UPI0037C546E9
MRGHPRLIIAACLAGSLALVAQVRADTMTWLLRDFPPSSMPVGGRPTQGMADEFVKAMVLRWPEAQHRYLVANNNRILSLLEAGEPACFTTALRVPARERQAYIADMLIVPPQMLIVRAETLPRLPLNAIGEVRLDAVLADASLRGLLLQSRSYGSQLDGQILARAGNSGLHLSAATAHPLRLVARSRADYTIDYDYTLAYEQHFDESVRHAGLLSLPIEGNSKMLVAGIACPRTEWGRQAILRIDQLIASLAQNPEARSGLERWMTPQSRQRYGRQIEKFYQHRSQPLPASAFSPPPPQAASPASAARP